MELISKEARQALALAAQQKEPIVDLELLGASPRTISILENSGITTMDILLHHTQEDLCSIWSIDKRSVTNLVKCLGKYHQLHPKLEEVAKKGFL